MADELSILMENINAVDPLFLPWLKDWKDAHKINDRPKIAELLRRIEAQKKIDIYSEWQGKIDTIQKRSKKAN